MMGARSHRQIMILALVFAVIGTGWSASAGPLHVGDLGLGESLFWDGPYVEAAGTRPPLEPVLCHGVTGSTLGCLYTSVAPGTAPVCLPGSCLEYTVDVSEDEGTLRVALDHPTADDSFSLVLLDPSGVPAPSWGWNIGTFSVESRAPQAAAGRWTVQALLHSVERSRFRMRAYLEPTPVQSHAVIPRLPNLQVNPPFDLTFDGCQASEILLNEPRPVKCLRFSTGPNNVGEGALDLRIREFGLTGPEVQRIYNSDGTFTERPAGTFVYHAQHGHYHHVGTAGFQLYRVIDAKSGTMESVGVGPKIGFCMADSLIADWSSFAQEVQNGRANECNGRVIGPPVPQVLEPVLDSPMFSLSAGWGDSYTYVVEGNYVDFGTNGNGSYVIRVAADPDDTLLEANESDNLGYVYFTVAAGVINVIERGRGANPWDPGKAVVNDGRRAVR